MGDDGHRAAARQRLRHPLDEAVTGKQKIEKQPHLSEWSQCRPCAATAHAVIFILWPGISDSGSSQVGEVAFRSSARLQSGSGRIHPRRRQLQTTRAAKSCATRLTAKSFDRANQATGNPCSPIIVALAGMIP